MTLPSRGQACGSRRVRRELRDENGIRRTYVRVHGVDGMKGYIQDAQGNRTPLVAPLGAAPAAAFFPPAPAAASAARLEIPRPVFGKGSSNSNE